MGPHSSECGNPALRIVVAFTSAALQWGRTHLSAETGRVVAHPGGQGAASMGPHSSECGNFNWPPQPVTAEYASMGPHSSECGNLRGPHAINGHGRASMGPHSSECGNCYIKKLSHNTTFVASMGPHSSECGNRSRGHS